MLTSKAISTISYNTKDYLEATLKRLLKNGIICEWYYIFHNGEYDDFTEEREKDHFHVYVMPSKRLDTEELRKEFIEIQTEGLPLGVMPFQSSKQDDWIMYSIHDVEYLTQKCEIKEYEYSWKQIQAYDDEARLRAVKHAKVNSRKELVKRDSILNLGVEKAWEYGLIRTSEAMGAIALERYYKSNVALEQRRQIIEQSKIFNEQMALEEENPFNGG